MLSSGIGVSEWNLLSSGLHVRMIPVSIHCWSLSAFDRRSVSLGGVSRSGQGPYPRYVSSSVGTIEANATAGGAGDIVFVDLAGGLGPSTAL